MKRLLACSLVLGAAYAAGCSSDTTLTTDAGVILPDTGLMGTDAGGSSTDSGSGNDAGMRMRPDMGPRPDTGPAVDMGNILPPDDAGSPFGDSGALGDPQWVALTVLTDGSMCTPLTPCGGDITGTWDVSGGCVAYDLSQLTSRCPGSTASATGRSRGRVVFDGTHAQRVSESQVDLQVGVPAFCANFVGGCMGIQTQLRMQAPDSACVTQTDGSCYCQAQYDYVINDADGYTTMNNEIIGASSGKMWAYCVNGSTLTYQDNSTSGMREPGIITLGMR
jgi:hypothetical protein